MQLNHFLRVLTWALLMTLVGAVQAQTSAPTGVGTDAVTSTTVPRFDHVVIAIMENTSETSIIGNTAQAPYINSLANAGANFTQSFAITHPSQPNYLALFSGSTQGTTDDSCPHTFSAANLGSELIGAGFTFAGYSEDLPAQGSTVCTSGNYARKHNPWVNFSNIPSASNKTFAQLPVDFTTLPTLAFVIPNLCDDMHDCSIATGDTWLKNNIDAYAQWAKTHNSLFILTWDEDDSTTSANRISTVFYGANIATGNYAETINHYSVLRTLEDMYGLAATGSAGSASAITDIWAASTPDYNIGVSPSALSVTQGASGSATATIASINGFNSAVSLSASGLPSGVTATFSPASVTPAANGSATSVLTLSASAAATTGTATVTITGTSGTGTHSATLSLTINPTPNFGLSAAPVNLSIARGTSGTDTATISSVNGFNSAVSLSVSGLPSGVTATFGSNPVTPAANGNATSVLTLSAASTAMLGTSTITVTGTSGSIVHTATFNLTVQTPDFSVGAAPSSLTIVQGGSGSDTATVTSLSGFNSAVSLSVSGLPSGVTAAFSPTSVTPAANASATSTLTLTASSTAATGTATITLSGTSGSTVHNATLSLTINPSSGSTVLSNGVPVTGLAATTGNKLNYTMVVPAGATNLKFTISGGTGDADLYVKFGAAPTLSSYDCRPYVSGNSESCPIATAQAGTYYVMLNAYASFTGVTLTGSYTAPGSGGTPTANFTFTMSGLTATFTDTSTDSGGTIGSHSWTFGDGATSTAASPSHTYASANTYSVTETVTDSVNGTSSSKTSSITISVSGNVLTNGVPVTGLSGSNGTLSAAYTLTVPAGKTSVTIKISGGTGDADLYVKLNAAPTLSSYDCRPYISGNSETCTFTPPAGGGTYYVKLNAYATYSGVSLTGSYSP